MINLEHESSARTVKIITILLLLLLALIPASLGAQSMSNQNVNSSGVALHGYDAVSFQSDGKAQLGSEQYKVDLLGARWYFASAAHRDAFSRNPDTYAPAFGGYCAWSVSEGFVSDSDPKCWEVVSGKLYLFFSDSTKWLWNKDREAHINDAFVKWPSLAATLNPGGFR